MANKANEAMKLIVGLGNPGLKYKETRHNVGYLVVERIAADKELSDSIVENKFTHDKKIDADICQVQAKGEKVVLAKPTTFMNLSGQVVIKMMQYFKLDISELIVISDDVDIPLGQVRIRLEGSSGGHNGLQNIIDTLGSDQFVRVRVGISDENKNTKEIDKEDNFIDTKDYVLSQFNDRELPTIKKVVNLAALEVLEKIGKKDPFEATTHEVE
jgi:PTH1 family peptidyl-tRNA hydrolase